MKRRLVAYYPLDEDSGSTAYDYSGNENDGTANGAGPSGTGTVSGPLGTTAYDFDGSDDSVQIPHPLSSGDNYTFSLLSKHDAPSDGDDDDVINVQQGQAFIFRDNGSGTVEYYHHNGTSFQGPATSSVSSGTWTHWVGSWDGSTFRLYKDGEEVDSVSESSGGGTGSDNSNLGEANGGNYFDGSVCDVRVYDRALSPNEVQYLYEVGAEKAYAVTEAKST